MTSDTTRKRRKWSTKQRAEAFTRAGGVCHICSGKIQAGQAFDLDHIIPLALGGEDGGDNLQPSHEKCHRGTNSKTSKDQADIARAKRLAEKHQGIRRPTGWGSKFKKKLNGDVVLCD